MKKNILLVIPILIVSLLISGCGKKDFDMFSGMEHKISDWGRLETINMETFYENNCDYSIVKFKVLEIYEGEGTATCTGFCFKVQITDIYFVGDCSGIYLYKNQVIRFPGFLDMVGENTVEENKYYTFMAIPGEEYVAIISPPWYVVPASNYTGNAVKLEKALPVSISEEEQKRIEKLNGFSYEQIIDPEVREWMLSFVED